jgi:hypothetical protein
VRAPDQSFADAIEAFLHRHGQHLGWPPLPEEKALFDRVRQCTSVPPARRPGDYPNLVESLSIAWSVAKVWPDAAEKHQLRREDAARKLEAVRLLREDKPYTHLHEPLNPVVKQWLDEREQEYAADAAQEQDRGEVLDLEYMRRDHLTVAQLGRKHRGAGITLFVREVSLAMREIFGAPHDKVVGELAGRVFETEPLPVETVRSMCKKTGSVRRK